MRHDPALDPVRRAARALDDLDDVDAIARAACNTHVVLLGAASHGTREFYALRAALTRQLNLGQLVRESTAPAESFSLGFSTDHGSVAAAPDWDAPVQFMRVTPARPNSWEELLHDTGLDLFLLPLGGEALQRLLAPPRLQRAIGVIYRPDTERQSHYHDASLSQQFDAVLHVDRSHALHPLDGAAPPQALEEPETFPSGL